VTKPRALLAVLALVVAACGGGDDASDETTAATTAATTASTAAPATTAGPATTESPATTTAGGDTTMAPSGDGIEINVVTRGDSFSVGEITVTAGQEVTIIVDDQDTETDDPHNFHVRAGDLNFFTKIEPAPNTQTLTFTIDTPGVYEFFCDTHAVTMNGLFIVEEEK
jgi:plastocyanin